MDGDGNVDGDGDVDEDGGGTKAREKACELAGQLLDTPATGCIKQLNTFECRRYVITSASSGLSF